MGRLLPSERPDDARNLRDVRPRLFVMGGPDQIPALVDELVLCLCMVVGDPEMVVLRVDVGEIEHLLEMPSDGAHEAKLDAMSCHGGDSLVQG